VNAADKGELTQTNLGFRRQLLPDQSEIIGSLIVTTKAELNLLQSCKNIPYKPKAWLISQPSL
jgi:hypothetical protein